MKRFIGIFLITFLCLNNTYGLSVTPSVSNLLCGTSTVTFTFDCAFTGNVLFTSSPPSSISYSITSGLLYPVVNGEIEFDVTVGVSNAPGTFNVNFVVLSTDMPGCAAVTDAANTNVNFNCVVPSNDVCAGAIPLTIATNTCSVASYSTLNSTTPSPAETPSCQSFGGWADLWYIFTANNTTITMEMISAPGFLGVSDLYNGTNGCANLGSAVQCNTIVVGGGATVVFTGLIVGDVYYLRLWHNPIENGTDQEICLHSTTPQPPACPNMVMLSGSESGTVDTESQDWIQSDQMLLPGSVVDYDATDFIELLPDFEVQLGSTFHAFIDGCGGSMLKGDKEVEIKK